MNFTDSIKTCLTKKYVDFNGRASRSEYWWFFLFCIIIGIIASMINETLYYIVVLALLLPSISVAVRRLHDIDMSGWWFLLNLIPIIGFLILLFLYCSKGTPGPNRFGDPVVSLNTKTL
jgi:uncharacterized membrane protein YhaH (DUF805 family)